MIEKIEIVRPAQYIGQQYIPEQRQEVSDKESAIEFANQLNRDNPELKHIVQITINP